MHFSEEFFQKFKFRDDQIKDYWDSAQNDLKIAEKTNIPEVIFKFAYDALIKLGIALLSRQGFKIRSNVGHHIKILEVASGILKDKEVEVVGNMMRRQRNTDLYHGGFTVTEKQSKEYLEFVKNTFAKAKKQSLVIG